jgi:hypothetical protein
MLARGRNGSAGSGRAILVLGADLMARPFICNRSVSTDVHDLRRPEGPEYRGRHIDHLSSGWCSQAIRISQKLPIRQHDQRGTKKDFG